MTIDHFRPRTIALGTLRYSQRQEDDDIDAEGDQFPDLMAAALRRQDLRAWAAKEDIKLVRPAE
jgi:hypothetical protein